MASICIVAEHQKGKLKKATLNSIFFGKEAAEKLGAELHILVIGFGIDGVVDELKGFGASKIHVANASALENYTAETWGHITAEVAKSCDAKIVGMNASTTGKDLMPRVAAKLEAGMASGIIGFDGECFTREMWAGNAVATVEIKTDIKIVTIQSTAFAIAEPTGGDTPVESLSVSLPETKTRFIEMHEAKSNRPDLSEAKVVISFGRGIKSGENIKLIEDLADLFGAAIGATRAAVDAGWTSNDLQVGQTGKIVAPELYVAIGLSGSMQHIAGMKNSKVIVAINKDEEAPIFQIADFGLVADLFKAVPDFIKTLKTTFNRA
ncbi:MAG: electron transfer flavoprotein subunit alpha/FixB family protein [Desulfobacterales bacterium]|jgi:electron transfer flavoprotein alpha subunit|nr:electron transfer flavoprotein subunit alpha/FixB family protein [Desulfobacterales bacterium]